MALKTNFNVDNSVKEFAETESKIKSQKVVSLADTPENKNEDVSIEEVKKLEKSLKNLRNEIEVFKNNGLSDLVETKKKEAEKIETQLKEMRKNQNFYKGNILVRLPEEKHKLYKSFAAENNLKLNQFVLLALAYTYNQIETNKIKIVDYGIETIPQL